MFLQQRPLKPVAAKGERATIDAIPPTQQLICVVVFVELCKLVAVDELDVIVLAHKGDRLINMLHLIVVRMGLTVWCNKTVDTEGSVVGLVAKVATV